ncbi:hypothetical protein ROLI_001520 [Roseobacter fucihabitans]|uniref:Uncharacterized protein n=1 Tax=Roseobacter fucihabitans TaxID=1537242 RepID=A0ABZ2BLU0_9RHOB|nr:hypothetical protein [Roseobacter litoralis]MBC6963402.1 hypothetical protein [Roseobacter litoralis]
MAYRSILTLTLSHDYYGSTALPLRVLPADAPAFAKAGLLLRQTQNTVLVLADDGDEPPETIALDLRVTSPEVFTLTQGADWGHVLAFDVTGEAFEFDAGKASARLPQRRAQSLARLSFDVAGAHERACSVHFNTVEAFWAYHVTGARTSEDLEIIDTASQTTFSAQGMVILPDGREAFVIRSDSPLPARARPDQKFTLQRPSAFGPEPLVPVLPAAGISFKPIDQQPGVAARLQSDIYVSLW